MGESRGLRSPVQEQGVDDGENTRPSKFREASTITTTPEGEVP